MSIHPLQSILQQFEWQSHFDPRTLQRARGYANSGHVLALEYEPAADGRDDNTGVLTGSIAGNRPRPYTCRIDIATAGRRLLLDTDCTCPVGIECKHAAAMLMTAARAETIESPGATRSGRAGALSRDGQARAAAPPLDLSHWQQWLASLDDKAMPIAEPERQFGILLRRQGEADLIAMPAWLRPSKNKVRQGILVDPHALQLDARHGAAPMPAEGWPADVAADLVTLLNAPGCLVGSQHWRAIQSVHVEQALERLLERHPAWYERGSQPLARAETLIPELYWHEDDHANQKLALRLPADDAVLLYGASVWYVQPARGRYGRIQGDRRLLERLRYAPSLEPRQAAAVRQQLDHDRHAPALPPPIDRGTPIVVQVAPVGVLNLRPLEVRDWNGRTRSVGLARVCFDYAGHRVDADAMGSVARRIDKGDLYEIHRSGARELQLLKTLDALGLSSATYGLFDYTSHSPAYDRDERILMQRNRAAAPEDWRPTIDKLKEAGFRIDYAPDFPHDELIEVDDWYGELTPSGNAWFDIALGIEVDGERIDLLPLLRQMLADPAFPRVAPKRERKNATWRVRLDDTRSAQLPLARLRALIEPLLEWLESESDGEARVHRSRAAELDAMGLPWQGGEALRAQLQQLQQARQPARAPRGFKASLRPYQRDGLAWLNFLGSAGLGGILADDMGLGKTVQVLAHILAEKQRKRLPHPALVVAPTSLVGNWASETARFAPTLKVLVIHGSDRADRYDDIPAHDLVITTYPLLPRDRDKLVEAHFSLLVLDEAQAIKNARSQAAQVVREIPAERRLAMTGTPLENHLGELWAQFDAVEPGLLGSERQFTRLYRTPIEKHGNAERQQRLNRRIGALLLRRRKDDVLDDLPPKNEIVRTLDLLGGQRELYETLRLAQHERVREAVKKRGFAQAGIIVLDALLKLRQACCDPRLVKLDSARKVRQSAKLEALLDMLDGLLGEGRRVLLFSQFTEMLGLIEAALDKRRVSYQTLTGQTPGKHRAALVKRFQDGKIPVFLISLKAGGVGLNLTAADTVIHYDPWWNPAVEAQATDRAHRIGQDKPVFVYRLICTGTVEEKIQALQARKADLARAVLEGGASQRLRFDEADLAELFGPP